MNNRKAASKITLGMLKGKSVNTSVPTISVRFNATAEKIEEIYQSEDESSEKTPSDQAKSAGDVETSPLRYLPRLGKRSASTDNSLTSHDASPTSDTWKFFSDIKGKITKNIEDTITEIKHRNQDLEITNKKAKELKDKENLSDSEDISESSISRNCGAASTTEGVEMSTDEDTPSLEKDKKSDDKLQQAHAGTVQYKSPTGVRQRIKIVKKGKRGNDYRESSININTLGRLFELNTGVDLHGNVSASNESVEVESGVEALEDTSLQNDSPATNKLDNIFSPEEIISNITEKIDNLEVDDGKSIIVQPITGTDIRQSYLFDNQKSTHSYFAPEGFVDLRGKHVYSRSWLHIIYSFRRFALFSILIGLYLYIPIPVYSSGFIAGTFFALALSSVYATFISPHTSNKPCVPNEKLLVTMPTIKEHIPISSFEGWMNEYPDIYNPLSYHVSYTQSVYVKLQGNLLRISHTHSKIPKRAMWNEPKHKVVFTQHRIYNLLGARIVLMPEGLHKKRHWNKKYPICISLSKDQLNFETVDNLATINLMDDSKDPSNSFDVVDDRNQKHSKKTKSKKKVALQPQIYSKLCEENLDAEFDTASIDTALKEEVDEETLSMRLNDSLADEEEILEYSQDFVVQEDDLAEDDILSLEEWSTYSPVGTPMETIIYLFGRTGREKEDWYRRFVTATHKGSDISLGETATLETETVSETLIQTSQDEEEYLKYMSQFLKVLPLIVLQRQFTPKSASKSSKSTIKEEEYLQAINVLWLNAVLGRVLYDWARDDGFSNMLKDKIQKKLMTIKLPYFIEQLSVHELSLGDTSPLIHNASKPILDQRGLWVDLDMSYNGNIVLTLQTKLNLMKLKDPHTNTIKMSVRHTPDKWQYSDEEDTAESSTDDDGNLSPPKILDDKGLPITGLGGSSNKSKKLIRMVDRIAESKIFKVATDNRYIKRAMEGVSNTELSLKVEVKGLIGTLVLNIPPPPSDRLWIGFRPAPKMYLTAQPIVGERNMSFIRYLTNWIEKKLLQEFQKIMVIPNMEDFSIPGMSPELPK